MTSSGEGSDDKIVVDTVELEAAGPVRTHRTAELRDEPPFSLGRGTRDQPPFPRESPRARLYGARGLDPVEVLRMWPHSIRAREDLSMPSPSGPPTPSGPPAPPVALVAPVRATVPLPVPISGPSGPSGRRPIADKIVLAHLALDLFHELEEDGHDADAAHGEAAACTNEACEARINALRGGLVEACLLVQRVVMMAPVANSKLEDHVRELLALLDR